MVRKKLIAVLSISALILVTSLLFDSCGSAAREDFLKYVEAHNSHNLDAIMNFYGLGAKYEIVGGWVKYGKMKIKQLEEFGIVTRRQYTVKDLSAKGDSLLCTLIEKNDFYAAAGLEEIEHRIRVIFEEGKIKEINFRTRQKSLTEIYNHMSPFYNWLKEERESDWQKLVPNGEFQYGRSAAQKWMSLIQEWKNISA